jgi:hypothetical protein
MHRNHFPPIVYICLKCRDKMACSGCDDNDRKEHIYCLKCLGVEQRRGYTSHYGYDKDMNEVLK